MFKIAKIKHAKQSQGLLRLCMMLPDDYYHAYPTREACQSILHLIYNEAKSTTFLRRNKWEPLDSAYNIIEEDNRIFIESIFRKPYLEFVIQECE